MKEVFLLHKYEHGGHCCAEWADHLSTRVFDSFEKADDEVRQDKTRQLKRSKKDVEHNIYPYEFGHYQIEKAEIE